MFGFVCALEGGGAFLAVMRCVVICWRRVYDRYGYVSVEHFLSFVVMVDHGLINKLPSLIFTY